MLNRYLHRRYKYLDTISGKNELEKLVHKTSLDFIVAPQSDRKSEIFFASARLELLLLTTPAH